MYLYTVYEQNRHRNIYCRCVNNLADRQRGRESEERRKTENEARGLSPMTASVPFPNRAMIVEWLVVTVLVEDVDGGCVVCVCVCMCRSKELSCARKQRTASPLFLS